MNKEGMKKLREAEDNKEYILIPVKGVAKWAVLRGAPNEMSGKYQMDVTQLSDAAVAKLEEYGVEVKSEDGSEKRKGYGRWITVKSGQPMENVAGQPPKLVDANKGPIADGVLIGNGSQVVVAVHPYLWEFKNKKGVGAGMNAVQVLELVEYTGAGGSALDVFEAVDEGQEIPF